MFRAEEREALNNQIDERKRALVKVAQQHGLFSRMFGNGRTERKAISKELRALYDEHRRQYSEYTYARDNMPELIFGQEPNEGVRRSGLQVFPRSIKLAEHPPEMRAAADTSPFFIRAVRVVMDETQAKPGLRNVLERGDVHLDKIAALCGARVVPHTYGLYDCAAQLPVRHPINAFGNGLSKYTVAAEVTSVVKHDDLNETHVSQIEAGLSEYYKTASSPRLKDLRPEQFMFGSLANEPGTKPSLFLIDIDQFYE